MTDRKIKPIDEQLAQTLLQRCVNQDERALAELHRLMARRIYLFAYQRLRTEFEAEIVVSDTLFEVWKSAGKFRGESKVSVWIFGIARYKTLAVLRDRSPIGEDIDEIDVAGASDDPSFDALTNVELKKLVDRCMEGLSGPHRECVQLALLEGYTRTEVAAILDIAVGTVKSRLHHAEKKMRTRLEEIGGNPL